MPLSSMLLVRVWRLVRGASEGTDPHSCAAQYYWWCCGAIGRVFGVRSFVPALAFQGLGLCAYRCALQTGAAPLFAASQNGHTEAAELLRSANADVNLASKVCFC